MDATHGLREQVSPYNNRPHETNYIVAIPTLVCHSGKDVQQQRQAKL